MRKNINDATPNVALGTAIIIVVMVIVFGAVFVWMHSMDMLFLPSFIEDFIGGDDKDELPWDLGTLSALIKNGKDEEGQTVTFDVSYENLRSALLMSERENGIYLSADVNYYDGGEAYTRCISYSRDGEKFRIELYEIASDEDIVQPMLEELKVSDGDNLFVLDSKTGESGTVARDTSVTAENEAGIPSIDTLLEAISAFPENESGSVPHAIVSDTELKLVRTDSGNVYYVAFTYADIGLREEYYVSLEHRIVISMQSRQNGELVYSYTTTAFSIEPSDYSSGELYDISKAAEQ